MSWQNLQVPARESSQLQPSKPASLADALPRRTSSQASPSNAVDSPAPPRLSTAQRASVPRPSTAAAVQRATNTSQRGSTSDEPPPRQSSNDSTDTAAARSTVQQQTFDPPNEWTVEAATPEHDPMTAAAAAHAAAAARKSRQSRLTLLRDPMLNVEIAGGVNSRAGASVRRSPTYGDSQPTAGVLARYRSRRRLIGRGDCPPDHNYLEAPFVESARRAGRFIHYCWLDQALCDVVLQTADGDLLAHRIILAAVSATLDALFRKNSTDAALTPQINLTEFLRETVADVVNFAYTGSIELDCKNIGPVTACAKELDFDIVVRICDDYLIDQCDPDNIVLHYSVAANCDLTETRDRLLIVICEAFSEISKNRHFAYLPYDRLVAILSNPALCVSNELDVFHAIVCWVDASRYDRLPVACRLLPFVRFQLIPADELAQQVQAIDWLFRDPDCMEPIWDAYKFHALQLAGSPAVRCMDQQSQRDCVQNAAAAAAVESAGETGSRASQQQQRKSSAAAPAVMQ